MLVNKKYLHRDLSRLKKVNRNTSSAEEHGAKLSDMEGVGFALARIFSERCAQHSGRPVADIDTVSRELQERGGLSPVEAENLLWGERPDLDLDSTKRLAEGFSLDADLLGCLLRPTSREIVLHVLRSFRSEMEPSCEDCIYLGSVLEETPRMSRADLMQVCLDFLEHFSIVREEKTSDGSDQLLEVFADLDQAARARVLAYAYNEAARSVEDPLQAQSAAYARLRDNLPRLARQVLDLLAQEEGEISVRQIAQKLHLRDARSVGQLPRSLQTAFAEEGLETPLRVRRPGNKSMYSMSPEARSLWLSLLRAEAAL